ncbi:MAG: Ig-like domain-containing protein [Candidatus Shapirobacteria bacterium]|jgi:hypothetical protein
MIKIIALFFLWMALPVGVMAGGFNLKSIGEVDTSGKQIRQWWYTGTQPVLRGEASPGATVMITIDSTPVEINADSSGNWDYAVPTALTEGDHKIELTSGGSNINFTLTIGNGNVNWEAVNNDSEALPAAGNSMPTAVLLVLGLMLTGMAGALVKSRS